MYISKRMFGEIMKDIIDDTETRLSRLDYYNGTFRDGARFAMDIILFNCKHEADKFRK